MELIAELGDVAGHQRNAPKSTALLYTGHAMAEKERLRSIPFTRATKTNTWGETERRTSEMEITKRIPNHGKLCHARGGQESISSKGPSSQKQLIESLPAQSTDQRHPSQVWRKGCCHSHGGTGDLESLKKSTTMQAKPEASQPQSPGHTTTGHGV